MEICTNCGEDFVPGSKIQKECKKCLNIKISEKITLLREINKIRSGNWNESVATEKADYKCNL